MHGYIAYCMKHGHDWQKEKPRTYRCAVCGARMKILYDGQFCGEEGWDE